MHVDPGLVEDLVRRGRANGRARALWLAGRVRERVAEPRYRPIRDYAAIGDGPGAALVSRDGSIDGCTLRRFDADPVFCRILDAERGGFRSIRPQGEYRAARSYLEDPLRPGVPGPPRRGAGALAIVGES